MHGCTARYVEAVPIKETFQGRTVWEGEVQVFAVNHPQASRCYAWSYSTTGTKRMFVCVLGVPPVVDARTAVQASIVAETR
jgi:hypothetical protein